MNEEEKFFGKSQGINPAEDTLQEVVSQMEEMDKKNQEGEGKGTVVFENKADEKAKIKLSTEKVPNFEVEEDIE